MVGHLTFFIVRENRNIWLLKFNFRLFLHTTIGALDGCSLVLLGAIRTVDEGLVTGILLSDVGSFPHTEKAKDLVSLNRHKVILSSTLPSVITVGILRLLLQDKVGIVFYYSEALDYSGHVEVFKLPMIEISVHLKSEELRPDILHAEIFAGLLGYG